MLESLRQAANWPATPWYATRRTQLCLLLVLVALLLVNAVLSIGFKVTDFEWHLEKGGELLFADPYPARYLTYPLPRLLMDAPAALLPPLWARAVTYPLAVGLLLWCVRTWSRLAAGEGDAPWQRWLPALAALFVLHPYLARDLNDCGPQIMTLAMLTAAFQALRSGRSVRAGFWLATALVWKTTPLLFLAYLVLKRRWLAIAAALGFTLLWVLAPVPLVGWEAAWKSYRLWAEGSFAILGQSDLTWLGYEAPRHQNQALRMVVARYLTELGPTHPIHAGGDLSAHPLYLHVLRLPVETAAAVYKGLILALGLLFAWRFRRPWAVMGQAAMGQAGLAREWAAVLLLMTLIGPSAWLHHFAIALPAGLLVARDLLAPRPGRWRLAGAIFIAVVLLLLQRDVVQRELSLLVLAYKFDAFAMWTLVALVLAPPGARRSP